MTPAKKSETTEIPEEITEAIREGTIMELMEWAWAEEAERKAAEPPPDPECDRLMCSNEPAIVCGHCGASYCELHPPIEEPLEACDRCGLDLAEQNPLEAAYEREMALAEQKAKERKEVERVSEEWRAREAQEQEEKRRVELEAKREAAAEKMYAEEWYMAVKQSPGLRALEQLSRAEVAALKASLLRDQKTNKRGKKADGDAN